MLLRSKPNPVKDALYLNFRNESLKDINVEIVNITGQKVFSSVYKCNQAQMELNINLNEITAGVYFVILSNEKGSEKYKFVRE